jgi:hypothetical protein
LFCPKDFDSGRRRTPQSSAGFGFWSGRVFILAIPRSTECVYEGQNGHPFAFPLLPGTMNYFCAAKTTEAVPLDETIVAAGD